MEKRQIGLSDIYVKPLGLGCMEIGGTMRDLEGYLIKDSRQDVVFNLGNTDEIDSINALSYAIENDFTFIDTAPAYGAGQSEIVIGKAIRKKRGKVILATKFGKKINFEQNTFGRYNSEDELVKSIKMECENSLSRLNTDYIDIYQYHQMDYDLLNYRDAVLEILESLVHEGKIRYYGWSTESIKCAQAFSIGEHFILVQFNNNYIQNNHELLQYCERNKIGIICRGILGMGFLSGKYTRSNYKELLDPTDFRLRDIENFLNLIDKMEKVKDYIMENGRTLSQGAIGWILGESQYAIPILGFRTYNQVINNIEAVEKGPLSKAAIDNIKIKLMKKE